MTITRSQAEKICMLVENYSSYVQQLSWNVMIEADKVVSDADIDAGFEELLHQTSSLFMEQIGSLTSYQMNFLKAVVDGVHSGFSIIGRSPKIFIGSEIKCRKNTEGSD